MVNYVSPSLLAANKEKLLDEIKLVESLGAEWIHWDVMDGKFVPNTSYTEEDVAKYAHEHKMFNDVHIMVADPFEEAPKYIKAGADLITFHIEAVDCHKCAGKLIRKIHEAGCKAGISIKPNTPVDKIKMLLDQVDVVLVMSVEPGKGGQKFMPESLKKIKQLRRIIRWHRYKCLIEVEGGVNGETGKLCKKAGADILVAG